MDNSENSYELSYKLQVTNENDGSSRTKFHHNCLVMKILKLVSQKSFSRTYEHIKSAIGVKQLICIYKQLQNKYNFLIENGLEVIWLYN